MVTTLTRKTLSGIISGRVPIYAIFHTINQSFDYMVANEQQRYSQKLQDERPVTMNRLREEHEARTNGALETQKRRSVSLRNTDERKLTTMEMEIITAFRKRWVEDNNANPLQAR